MTRTLLAFLIALSYSGPARPAKVPGQIPERVSAEPRTGATPKEYRGLLGLSLGRSGLAEVQKRLGKAPIIKTAQSEGSPNAVCYISAADDTIVVFEAGPLGGFEKLTAITVTRARDFSGNAKDCSRSSAVSRKAATVGRLRIGGRAQEFGVAFQSIPSISVNGISEIAFSQRPKSKGSREASEYEVSSGIILGTANSCIEWYQIYFYIAY